MSKYNPYDKPFKTVTLVDYANSTMSMDQFNDDAYYNDYTTKLRNKIAIQIAQDTDSELLRQLTALLKTAKIDETEEQKVIRILKHDFESTHGITFERFIEVYHNILRDSPEKLI